LSDLSSLCRHRRWGLDQSRLFQRGADGRNLFRICHFQPGWPGMPAGLTEHAHDIAHLSAAELAAEVRVVEQAEGQRGLATYLRGPLVIAAPHGLEELRLLAAEVHAAADET